MDDTRNKGGRPVGAFKGDAARSRVLSARVEPWVVEQLDEDRHPGESRADVLTRWASDNRQDGHDDD
jgi:hypothetical protein